MRKEPERGREEAAKPERAARKSTEKKRTPAEEQTEITREAIRATLELVRELGGPRMRERVKEVHRTLDRLK